MLLILTTQTTIERGENRMNENYLRGEITKRGYTIDRLCSEAGFSRSTFDRKIKGDTEFNRDEIEKIAIILNLSDKDILDIFYPNYVAEKCNK
jgi:AraC-like DNA-binding protein